MRKNKDVSMTSVKVLKGFGQDDGLTYPTITDHGIKELTPSQREELLQNPHRSIVEWVIEGWYYFKEKEHND